VPATPDPNEPVVLVHKDLPGQEYVTTNLDLVETLAESGWKRQSKAAAAKTEEK
jgi:hypothetical protein